MVVLKDDDKIALRVYRNIRVTLLANMYIVHEAVVEIQKTVVELIGD